MLLTNSRVISGEDWEFPPAMAPESLFRREPQLLERLVAEMPHSGRGWPLVSGAKGRISRPTR